MRMDPERAHSATLAGLDRMHALGLTSLLTKRPPSHPVRVFGLDFPNAVGLAAGLDKNAGHVDALFALGFGFVEVGTITPRPQSGNPKPRLFRIPEENAIINRMGFNNDGMDAAIRNLEASRFVRANKKPGILGINIGKNKDTDNDSAWRDYVTCFERAYPLADYVTVNISSPNTMGLRELQEEQALRRLIASLFERREQLATRHGRRVPVLVKLSPDLAEPDIDAAARVFTELKVDGVIATNTTISRLTIQAYPQAAEAGGLSGGPLLARSTSCLRRLCSRLDDSIPVIGVGGICKGADAVAKTAAGATLVQLYTGFVYRGPRLIAECAEAIRRRKVDRASGIANLP